MKIKDAPENVLLQLRCGVRDVPSGAAGYKTKLNGETLFVPILQTHPTLFDISGDVDVELCFLQKLYGKKT